MMSFPWSGMVYVGLNFQPKRKNTVYVTTRAIRYLTGMPLEQAEKTVMAKTSILFEISAFEVMAHANGERYTLEKCKPEVFVDRMIEELRREGHKVLVGNEAQILYHEAQLDEALKVLACDSQAIARAQAKINELAGMPVP